MEAMEAGILEELYNFILHRLQMPRGMEAWRREYRKMKLTHIQHQVSKN
jgi:hypothetical protein